MSEKKDGYLTEEEIQDVIATRNKCLEMKDLIPHPQYPLFEPTTLYLVEMLKRFKPVMILDTGSGMTSVILRKFAPRSLIVSVDNDLDWLEKSRELLRRFHLDHKGFLVLWDTFKERDKYGQMFDFISHDMGNMGFREETLAQVMSYGHAECVVLLDNAGIDGYKDAVIDYMSAHGFKELFTWPADSLTQMDNAEAGGFAAFTRGV